MDRRRVVRAHRSDAQPDCSLRRTAARAADSALSRRRPARVAGALCHSCVSCRSGFTGVESRGLRPASARTPDRSRSHGELDGNQRPHAESAHPARYQPLADAPGAEDPRRCRLASARHDAADAAADRRARGLRGFIRAVSAACAPYGQEPDGIAIALSDVGTVHIYMVSGQAEWTSLRRGCVRVIRLSDSTDCGTAMKMPCAYSTPMSARQASTSAVSTRSATVLMPIARPICVMASTMLRSTWSVVTFWMNCPSIFR